MTEYGWNPDPSFHNDFRFWPISNKLNTKRNAENLYTEEDEDSNEVILSRFDLLDIPEE